MLPKMIESNIIPTKDKSNRDNIMYDNGAVIVISINNSYK
jgi:hypothetical protein